MCDRDKKVLNRKILLPALMLAGLTATACLTMDPVRIEVLAGRYLPAESEAAFYVDLSARQEWRMTLADLAPVEDREAAVMLLGRSDRAWGAVTSLTPFQGVFVLNGRFGYGELKMLLTGRDEWQPFGKDGFSHRDRPLVLRVPVRKVLVVAYGYPDGELPPVREPEQNRGEILRLTASPRMDLPVTGLELSLFEEGGIFRLSGVIIPEEGKGFLLLPAFKGFLTLWARMGGDSVFTESYRQSSLVVNDEGNIGIDNLYFADPLPFLMELTVPGVLKK